MSSAAKEPSPTVVSVPSGSGAISPGRHETGSYAGNCEHPPGQEALITTGVRGFDPTALARVRKARGLSQEALGAAVGRARTNIIPWERSAGDTPSPRNLVLLAQVLDVRPWELTTVDPETAELADLRTWAGLTQRELADAAGIPRSSYSLLERGGLPLHADAAERIAAELGRTVEEVQRAYERSRAGADSRRPEPSVTR